MTTLTCATWNIHRARGNDGRVDPGRSVEAIATELWRPGLDLLALQEADAEAHPHRGLLDLDALQARTGLRHAHPEARWGPESQGFHGVMVLASARIEVTGARLLDLPGHCPRGAVVLEAACGGVPFRLLATHLSLGQILRAVQMRTIGQYLTRVAPRPTILLGDLNEWRPWGGLALAEKVAQRRWSGPAKATFPAARPLMPLDRILCTGRAQTCHTIVADGPLIRAASDHRPLRGEVRLPG